MQRDGGLHGRLKALGLPAPRSGQDPACVAQLLECAGIEAASRLRKSRTDVDVMQPFVLTLKIEASPQRTKELSQKSGKLFAFQMYSFSNPPVCVSKSARELS